MLSGIAAPPRREWWIIGVCAALLTALSWAYLVRLEREMCLRMGDDVSAATAALAVNLYWTPADRWLNFSMWTVMMIGMMAPSAAPLVALFAAAKSRAGSRGGGLAIAALALGYVAVWTLFSGAATVAQWALHQHSLLSAMMTVVSPWLAGAILIVAGAYQLTPWKAQCLTHCRSPLGFLLSRWREGVLGAFRMGFAHGMYCLGCCWALMAVLFAVGIMNLAWVAALTLLVFAEKIGPIGVIGARVSGVGLAALGIAKILG